MIAAQRGFSAEQRTIISGAFEIADRILREILVHRRDVVGVPASMPARQALQRLVQAGRHDPDQVQAVSSRVGRFSARYAGLPRWWG